MTGTDVLASYARLAATLGRMLELARQLQWAQLPVLDARCTELFLQLRDAGLPAAGFSAAERERVAVLTARIRQDQQALQALLAPQFQHLARRMADGHGGR